MHLDSDVGGLTEFGSALASGRLPDRPFLLLGQMTTADPSRSPQGTETAWAYTHVPRGLPWDFDAVRRYADRIEQVVERLVFRPLPGVGRADTPIDRLYLAGASAHPGGAVHGGPGANAARAALARAGVGDALYGRSMRALQDLIHA